MTTEPEVSDPFRTHLKVAVSGLLTELGFSTADAAALETLTELTQSFIGELGRSARSFCELACRVEPVSADILLALVEMGVPVSGLHAFATRSQRVTIPAPSQLTTPKQTSILHTGLLSCILDIQDSDVHVHRQQQEAPVQYS